MVMPLGWRWSSDRSASSRRCWVNGPRGRPRAFWPSPLPDAFGAGGIDGPAPARGPALASRARAGGPLAAPSGAAGATERAGGGVDGLRAAVLGEGTGRAIVSRVDLPRRVPRRKPSTGLAEGLVDHRLVLAGIGPPGLPLGRELVD